ncbi:MAG: malonic semialdehyde reductase [Pseudomonas sp.]
MFHSSLDDHALDQLFRNARSRNRWRREQLPESLWRTLYDLLKFGPTSANVSPARFVFVTSEQGKTRLAPHLSKSNRDKSLDAPAIAIIGQDLAFAEKMPQLFPHSPSARHWFATPEVAAATASRNTALQGAYLILAARALGLDAGPMSGFDNAGVDAEFFSGTQIRSDFICALGHGIDEPFPRLPRLPFEEACIQA